MTMTRNLGVTFEDAVQAIYDDGLAVLNTPDLLSLAQRSKGRNRALDHDVLARDVDPAGLHLLTIIMLHNDREWRCGALIKVKDATDPLEAMVDVAFDEWEALRANTKAIAEGGDIG